MKWNLAGKALALYVEFRQDGEFVIPDVGSLKLTLRGNNGVVISGYNEAVLPDCPVSTTTIGISSTLNTIIALTFETRYVRVDFTVGGRPLAIESSYRLAPFLPLTATPADVRSVFGARDSELPDSEIDLMEGYFTLLEDYPIAMAGALATSATSRWANLAVTFKTSLQLIASMPVRVLKEEALNNASQSRGKIDWEALQAQIEAGLGVVLGKLEAAAQVPGGTSRTPLLVLSLPTDPVTNA